MIFDVQRKLTDLNKRVFDLENLLAGLGPTTTILDLLSPPPFIPWQPTPEAPHELGGPRHTGVGDGLERDGTDLRVDEDAAFAWTGMHVFNEDGADINFRIEAVGMATAFQLMGATGNLGLGGSPGAVSLRLYRAEGDATFVVKSATDDAVAYLDAPADEYCRLHFRSAGNSRFQLQRIANSNDLGLMSHSGGIGTVMNWEYATGYTDAKYLLKLQAGLTFYGETGLNVITVPDDVAQAMHLVDAGGTEFLRIRTDGTPTMVFNEGGVEIDFRFEAVGEPDAIFLDGATGKAGYGTPSPAGILHLYRAANTQHRLVIDAQGLSDGQTAVIDLVTKGDGTKTVGDAATLGWHITARGDAYATAAQQNDLLITYWDGSTFEYILLLDHTGAVSIIENSATVRLSGTIPIQLAIGEPIVETFGQWRIPWACTVVRVDGNVIGSGTTCTVNVEERATPGGAGTDVLSSDMVADENGESVTSGFNNAALAAGSYLAIDVSAVSGNVDCLSITLTVTID